MVNTNLTWDESLTTIKVADVKGSTYSNHVECGNFSYNS